MTRYREFPFSSIRGSAAPNGGMQELSCLTSALERIGDGPQTHVVIAPFQVGICLAYLRYLGYDRGWNQKKMMKTE